MIWECAALLQGVCLARLTNQIWSFAQMDVAGSSKHQSSLLVQAFGELPDERVELDGLGYAQALCRLGNEGGHG